MDKLVIALLETSVSLVLFYAVFYIWLKRETFFKENRFYLLLAASFSLIIPWINFTLPNSQSTIISIYNMLDSVSVSASGYEQSLVQTLSAWQWLSLVYIIGVIVSVFLLVTKIIKLIITVKKSTKRVNRNVVFIDADVVPFSFLNRIYINPDTYSKKQLNDIIAHESMHINQQHTYDCLFYELLIVFFWFNPIVYKYRDSAKELHEYLADEGAVRSGIEEVEYQKLLFEQATGLKTLTLADSFNYSLIKRRLIMLTKIKSKRIAKIRLLYFAPVLLGLLVVFACNQVDDEKIIIVDETVQNSEIFMEVEEMPEFEGGDNGLRVFIAQNVTFPEQAKKNGESGKVFVQFCVDATGKVCDVEVLKGVSESIDAEATRVISSLPDWKPGKHDGKAVKVSFTIPINFKLN